MELHPEIAALLSRQQAEGLPPRHEMPLAAVRERLRSMNALAAPAPELAGVANQVVVHGDVQIPVRVYRPEGTGALPALLYVHGGRFISGDLESHDNLCRHLAARGECVVVGVGYRLAPEHQFPAALEDVRDVLHWMFHEAGRLGIDAGRIAIGGDSAGGGLAAAVALIERPPSPYQILCQLLVYPMLDATCSLPSHEEFRTGPGPSSEDMRLGYDLYLRPEDNRKDPRVSPLHSPFYNGLAPAFVLTVDHDSLLDEGELFALRAREAQTPVEYVRIDGAVHGIFQMPLTLEKGAEAFARAADYLRRQFRAAQRA